MSHVAAQVILHPKASQALKVLSTTLGRDKLYRTLQYFARFLAWYLLARGYKQEGARWNALKAHLTSGRKLIRLGKPLEHLQAALKASQATAPAAEQATTIGRQIGYAGYLTFDSFVWANTIKFINLSPEAAQQVSKIANRCWLAGILFSLANGAFKTTRLTAEVKQLKESVEGKTEAVAKRKVAIASQSAAIRSQFILDILDLWIPATNLGFVNFNDGILGLFGFTTSVLALSAQWHAANKTA